VISNLVATCLLYLLEVTYLQINLVRETIDIMKFVKNYLYL